MYSKISFETLASVWKKKKKHFIIYTWYTTVFSLSGWLNVIFFLCELLELYDFRCRNLRWSGQSGVRSLLLHSPGKSLWQWMLQEEDRFVPCMVSCGSTIAVNLRLSCLARCHKSVQYSDIESPIKLGIHIKLLFSFQSPKYPTCAFEFYTYAFCFEVQHTVQNKLHLFSLYTSIQSEVWVWYMLLH